MAKKKERRMCKQCWAWEKISDLGGVRVSNLTPYSSYCVDCINKFMKAMK